MKIPIEQITKDGINVKFAKGEDWFQDSISEERDSMYSYISPVSIEAELRKIGYDILVKANIKTEIGLSCSRCLKEFHCPILSSFSLVFSPFETGNDTSESSTAEVIQYYNKNSDEVNLSQPIRDQLLLEIPMNPLCSVSCKGLCQQCGINLNEEECDCKIVEADKPFSALKNFKIKKKGAD